MIPVADMPKSPFKRKRYVEIFLLDDCLVSLQIHFIPNLLLVNILS